NNHSLNCLFRNPQKVEEMWDELPRFVCHLLQSLCVQPLLLGDSRSRRRLDEELVKDGTRVPGFVDRGSFAICRKEAIRNMLMRPVCDIERFAQPDLVPVGRRLPL